MTYSQDNESYQTMKFFNITNDCSRDRLREVSVTYCFDFRENLELSESEVKIPLAWENSRQFSGCPKRTQKFHMSVLPPRCRHLCKFFETKESVYIRKEFNFHRFWFGTHQHGRLFIVLERQHGRCDVTWKSSTSITSINSTLLITRHYPDLSTAFDWMKSLLHPIRSSISIRVVTWHQYGISAGVPKMSLREETNSVAVKRRLCFLA